MNTRILPPTPQNLEQAAKSIRGGEIVAMPTETVYGLAGSIFNPQALTKIFETKERPKFDPLIVHVSEVSNLMDLEKLHLVDTKKLGDTARGRVDQLIQGFWPGPLTLVLPKHRDVPDLATSGLETVAVRMPRHPVAQKLIEMSETPVAAPSANRFGKISPTSAQAVFDELKDRIELILDGGSCEIGLESTVLSVDQDGELTILRPGGTTREAIEKKLGVSVAIYAGQAGQPTSPNSPGLMKSHYAPSKPLRILPAAVEKLNMTQLTEIVRTVIHGKPFQETRAGVLMMSGNPDSAEIYLSGILGLNSIVRTFSRTGNIEEIARNFFTELRKMDQEKIEIILVEPCPTNQGLGLAIMDRLDKASG